MVGYGGNNAQDNLVIQISDQELKEQVNNRTPWISVTEKPFNVLDNGSDQTSNIQAALNSGAKKVIFPNNGSSIYFATALTIPEGVTVEGEGFPTLKIAGAVDLGSRSRLKGLLVDCSEVPGGINSPILVNEKDDVKISNIQLNGLVSTIKNIHVLNSSNVVIEDCNITGGRFGIYFDQSSKCEVFRGNISAPAETGIMVITNQSKIIENIMLHRIMIDSPGLHGVQYWGGDAAVDNLRTVKKLTVSKVSVKNAGGACIWGSLGEDIIYEHNNLDTCTLEGLDFEGSMNCIATGNTVRNARLGALSCFFGSKNITYEANKVITDGGGELLGTGHNPLATNMVVYIRDDCENINFNNNTFICTSQTAVGELNVWKGTTTNHSTKAGKRIKFKLNTFENCVFYAVQDAQDIDFEKNEFYRVGEAVKNLRFIWIFKSSVLRLKDNKFFGDRDATTSGSGGSAVYITQNVENTAYPVTKVVIENNEIFNYPLAGITLITRNGSNPDGSVVAVRNNKTANVYHNNTQSYKLIEQNYDPLTMAASLVSVI